MDSDEMERLRGENRRLLDMLAWSHRRCERLERLAVQILDDLVERIEWTGETESLEAAEAARTDLICEVSPLLDGPAAWKMQEPACG